MSVKNHMLNETIYLKATKKIIAATDREIDLNFGYKGGNIILEITPAANYLHFFDRYKGTLNPISLLILKYLKGKIKQVNLSRFPYLYIQKRKRNISYTE